jgi:gluconate kinase
MAVPRRPCAPAWPLLESQFKALEEPQADEHPIVVSIAPHPREIVESIAREFRG